MLHSLGRSEEAAEVRRRDDAEFDELYSQAQESDDMLEDLMSMTLHRGWSLEKAIERFQQAKDPAPASHGPPAAEDDDSLLGTAHPDDEPPQRTGGMSDFFDTAHQGADADFADAAGTAPALDDQDGYEIRGRIAIGGSATLYRAWDPRLSRWVAIKVVRKDVQSSRWIIENEARFLSQLMHPYIVPVLSAGRTAGGAAYLTMPLYDDDLRRLIQDQDRSLEVFLRWLTGICDALEYAHQRGVIHGDPKPSNIVVKGEQAALIDWGLAAQRPHFVASEPVLHWVGVQRAAGQIVGTPAFMAPEQLHAEQELSPATDVYVLGGTMYTILTGRPPYADEGDFRNFLAARHRGELQPTPVRRMNPRAPKQLVQICEKAMAPAVNDRFQTAAEFKDAIQQWLGRSWWRRLGANA